MKAHDVLGWSGLVEKEKGLSDEERPEVEASQFGEVLRVFRGTTTSIVSNEC